MTIFLVPLVVVVRADSISEVDEDRIATLLMSDIAGVESVQGMGVVEAVDDPDLFWQTVAQMLKERDYGT